MTDFQQNGVITTFHDLGTRNIAELEQELTEYTKHRRLALVLPSLFSELEGRALPAIVEQLKQCPYISEIVIGLDRADEKQFQTAREFFSVLPQQKTILWNEGPRLQAIDEELKSLKLSPTELGKGRNVWFCFGYVLAKQNIDVVALHDCDILTYHRDMLTKLVYPVCNPNYRYLFSKGYYSRIAENQFKGRVCRLLVTPLLIALRKLVGFNDYLHYLESFRYPLAGEFAFRTIGLSDMRIPSDWGLEIGVLSEIRRNWTEGLICQVDIADIYDHKHQPLSANEASKGLSRMSLDITKSVLRKLAADGTVFTSETFRSLKATYHRTALDLIDSYYSDAKMNGLQVDRHGEEAAVELFARNIVEAGNIFLDKPMEVPFIPSWNRVQSASPDLLRKLKDAVEADNA